jgi:hypothetical protein
MTHTEKHRTPLRQLSLLLLAVLIVSQSAVLIGCHRGFYRRQADTEAKRLVAEKAVSPRWNSATGGIEIDPQSRMFDPFSADHPPIPPDDPAAHDLMHSVDGKPGYPHWHANGNTDSVESPNWRSYLPVNEKGEAVLSLSAAYQLALIHSPELQQQRETLYLSALEVSLQRFGFDSQLFSGFNTFLNNSGRFSGSGSSTSLETSLGSTGSGINAQRLGITGANFVVGLANTILWEFSGNNTQSANTLINFSLIQPLLRGAGRERILESLTQSERILLANVRQLERFRRGFYLEVATGRNAGAGTSANSGAFLNSPGIAGANVGGYLGLLQQKQQIKNIEFSVAQFTSLLKQFRELFDRDRIRRLQVAQFESSVYSQQQNLLNARVNYQDSLDQFKVQIGLPPDLAVVIEDPFLDRFNLIDDLFPKRLEEIKKLRDESSGPIEALSNDLELIKDIEAGSEKFVSREKRIRKEVENIVPILKRTQQLLSGVKSKEVVAVEEDIKTLKKKLPRRLSYLSKVKDDIASGTLDSDIEPSVFTQQSIPDPDNLKFRLAGEEPGSYASKLESLAKEVNQKIEKIERFEELSEQSDQDVFEFLRENIVKRLPDLLNDTDGIVLEIALLQAKARANSIEIADVKIDSVSAFETARCMRRDWMNARAALVDNWRQIEFFADQLEAEVDLVFTGDVGNVGDNPFNIRYETGNLGVGFRFDAPIVRQQERNDYRAAQIGYQQARRSYYQFEDTINQSLRQTLRNIQQDKLLFELNRQNIQVQIDQVELARADLVAPPDPGVRPTLDSVTAQFLAQAINGLTGVQNGYLQLWVEYEVLRRNLDFDLGTMELDDAFEWVDPGEIDTEIGLRAAARNGIAGNDRYCCGMQQGPMMNVNDVQYQTENGSAYSSSEVMEAPDADADAEVESLEYETEPESVTPAEPEAIEVERPVPESLDLEPRETARPSPEVLKLNEQYSLPPLGIRKTNSGEAESASRETLASSTAKGSAVAKVDKPVVKSDFIVNRSIQQPANLAQPIRKPQVNRRLNPFKRVSYLNGTGHRKLIGSVGQITDATGSLQIDSTNPLGRILLASGENENAKSESQTVTAGFEKLEFRPLPTSGFDAETTKNR